MMGQVPYDTWKQMEGAFVERRPYWVCIIRPREAIRCAEPGDHLREQRPLRLGQSYGAQYNA